MNCFVDYEEESRDEDQERTDVRNQAAPVIHVRDGRIELPTSVWKTDVLPLN